MPSTASKAWTSGRRRRWRGSCCRWPTGCRKQARAPGGLGGRGLVEKRAELRRGLVGDGDMQAVVVEADRHGHVLPHHLFGDEAERVGSGVIPAEVDDGHVKEFGQDESSSRWFSAPMSTRVSPKLLPESSWTIRA